MGQLKNLIGNRYGRLVVIAQGPSTDKKLARWICRCDCGNEKLVRGPFLRRGNTTSCGCFQREKAAAINRETKTTHGKTYTCEFRIWGGIKTRCTNSRAKDFPQYGGRGIKLCERWQSFENFLADMGPRPSAKHSIDRIDNDDDYRPGNCRWTDNITQSLNRRTNRRVTINGRTQTASEWAKETGLQLQLISYRARHNWPEHLLLSAPQAGPKIS